MSINFSETRCQDKSAKKLFGLCDDQPGKRAYLDETDGRKWIAIVVNEAQHAVTFTAIDHCIDTLKPGGAMDSRCDGVLTYSSGIVFVELKERGAIGNAWVKDGEKQLRASVGHYTANTDAEKAKEKRAYIANKEHPKFKESQARRMLQFLNDTGYVLRIENRIVLA